MSRAGMVIGLGGIGVSVVHRIRTSLISGPGGKVPENVRLLAFDILRPTVSTGRLGQPYYFLVRLPPGDGGVPTNRQAARQVLLNDLEKGGPSSLVLRGLSLNMEALRRAGYSEMDVFLVSSTFGSTGSAWLVDMAYLCRRAGAGRTAINVHAVLLAPETCQSAFPIMRAHQMTSFAVFKELESFQKERDWGQGFPLYGGKYLAGMPGQLNAAPFTTIQVIDGQSLGGSLEQSAIPSAADGILCQLDERVAQIFRQERSAPARRLPAGGRDCFSSLGVQSLVHPTRLLVESGVERAILGMIEALLPLRKAVDSGRPESLEPAHIIIPSDPYSDVETWLGYFSPSGVLTDVMFQVGLSGPAGPAQRQDWVNRLAERDINQWKATLYQIDGVEELLPPGGGNPESFIPLIQRHFHAYLQALAQKVPTLEENPSGPQEYLSKLEATLTDYIADLGKAEEILRRQNQHSESESMRQLIEESRRDWEQKRASSWSRLFPQRAEEAEERYITAMQTQVAYKQREAMLSAVRKSASLMLNLTRKLIEYYRYYTRVLALSRDSLYNLSLDHLQHIQRELEQETAVRSQQIVVDESYEERQIRLVFEELLTRIYPAVQTCLMEVEEHVDWLADSLQFRANLSDPAALEEALDLVDLNREPDEMAAALARSLSVALTKEIGEALSGNSILNFLNYLDPRADQLGARMVEQSGPLAKTIVPPAQQVAFLFTPQADAAERIPYVRDLVYELYQQLGELYQIENGDPDRMTLFRRFDGLTLDNLATFHASVPPRFDPVELKQYVLWIL